MTKQIGRQVSFGIALEASRGVAESSADFYIPWMELTAENRHEIVNDEVSLARIEDSDGAAIVKKFGETTIKTKLKDVHIGALLKSLLGSLSSVAKSAPNAAVYDHTFSVLQSVSHPTITGFLKDANKDIAFANMLVDYLKISVDTTNYVLYEARLVGKSSASASTTVAHTTEKDFVPQMLVFKRATAQSGLDAASEVKIRSLTLEIKQNATPEHVLGDADPNDILNGPLQISGSITLVNDGATFETLQSAETYNALRFDFIHTDTIGSSSNPELKIDLHRCRISNYEQKRNLNGHIEESFDFKAFYSQADSKMITAILTNLQTSY